MIRLIKAMSFALILAVTPLTSVGAGDMAPREGWVVHDTSIAYGDLVKKLSAAVRAEKMGVVNFASASDGARMQGFTIPGNRVVGVYRNDFARRMLAASLAAGIEAPIRYYITENADGTATLSYRTPTAVFAPYFDEGGDDLRTLATELDSVFDTIAQRAITD